MLELLIVILLILWILGYFGRGRFFRFRQGNLIHILLLIVLILVLIRVLD